MYAVMQFVVNMWCRVAPLTEGPEPVVVAVVVPDTLVANVVAEAEVLTAAAAVVEEAAATFDREFARVTVAARGW